LNSKIFIEKIKEKYKFYTNKEVADHFGVTRSRVSQWINTNKIPKRYLDTEKNLNLKKVSLDNTSELMNYKKIVQKQMNYIELLETKVESQKSQRNHFNKEIAANWEYDVKVKLSFNSLRATELEEVKIYDIKIKELSDYLGYTKEEFKNNVTNWLDSPMFNKDEIFLLHQKSEEKRISAIKHELDSYYVTDHVKYYKKNGKYVWGVYRAHFELNQNTCITKLKLLTNETFEE